MATLCIMPHSTQYNNNFKTINNSSSNNISNTCNSNSNSISNCSSSNIAGSSKEPPKISKFFSNSSNYQSKIQQLISFSFTSTNFIFITFILSISKLCTTAATDPTQTGAPHAATTEAPPGFLMANFNSSALLEKLNSFRATTVGTPTQKGKHTPAAGNSIATPSNSGGQTGSTSNSGSVIVSSSPAIGKTSMPMPRPTPTLKPSLLSATSSSSSSSVSKSSLPSASSSLSSPTSSPSSASASSSSSSVVPSLNFHDSNDVLGSSMGFKFLNISGKVGTPLGIGQNLTKQCDEKQFRCGNGECLPVRFLCDGESDCADHSDEMIPECRFKGKLAIIRTKWVS